MSVEIFSAGEGEGDESHRVTVSHDATDPSLPVAVRGYQWGKSTERWLTQAEAEELRDALIRIYPLNAEGTLGELLPATHVERFDGDERTVNIHIHTN